jgi:hypothetical protein
MDADAFIKKYSTVSNYEADAVAASFILALSVIDRTILPRVITFQNDAASLRLAVAGRKAHVMDRRRLYEKGQDECAHLVQLLAAICKRAPIKRTIRSMDRADDGGYNVSQLVNSQYPANISTAFDSSIAHTSPGKFSFDQKGWPVAMPEDTSAKALDNAWRSTIGARGFLDRTRKACGSTVLMIAISSEASAKVAFHASPERTDILPVSTSSLGQLISAWKASSSAE